MSKKTNDAATAASDIMSRIRKKHAIEAPAPVKAAMAATGTAKERAGKRTPAPVTPKAEPKVAAPAPKPAKEFPICACGCGEHTRGGTYRPGHDSKHKSALAGPKVMPDCGCGCGDKTRGGRFLPGHDAKYYSQLRKAEKAQADAKKQPKAKAVTHAAAA